jgi:opacity protein-like surface antigen
MAIVLKITEETLDMKHMGRYLFLLVLLLLWIPFANAQSADINIGFGTAQDKSNGAGIDNFNSINAGLPCIPGSGDPYCDTTPALKGFFLGFGADAMISKRYGVGGEISFLPAKQDYGPLQFRQTFYDFNGIFAPVNEKRVQLKIMGGIGGSKTGFSINQSLCVGTAVCSNSSQSFGSANHFQLHAGVGIELLLTEHVFVRPQFDFRYVPNFTEQFNSSIVTGGMLWIGFRTGR